MEITCQEDVRIPLPFGHLSTKIWGPDDGIPVLALHGWQDNAGSFDALAPLLPSNIRLVCLDFCGNGFSSPNPPGTYVNYFDHLYHIRTIFDFFKWKQATIIAHSMGGISALFFTAIYPQLVSKLICIDVIKQTSWTNDNFLEALGTRVSRFMTISHRMTQGPQSSISYEKALNKTVQIYGGSLNRKAAEILLIRGLKKRCEETDEWEFTRDLRSILTPTTTDDQLGSAIRAIRCPFLLIKPKNSYLHGIPEFNEFFQNVFLKSTGDTFRLIEVEGNHHVHLTHPHLVAPHVTNFLFPMNAKL